MTSADEVTVGAKTIDFVIRSCVTAAITIGLAGALIYAALTGHDFASTSGTILVSATSMAFGYYFGNHSAVNGSMIQSTAARRDGDLVRKQVAEEAALITASTNSMSEDSATIAAVVPVVKAPVKAAQATKKVTKGKT